MIFIIPFITAFIGWITNFVAIKMLFKPREPVTFGFTFHGLIPKRQKDMAVQCAEIIERELLQQDMLGDTIRKVDISYYIRKAVHTLVEEKLPAVLKMISPDLVDKMTADTVKMIELMIVAEISNHADTILSDVADNLNDTFNIRDIVEDRIANFDLEKLENIVWEVSRKEFKTIEYLGGVLGFLIGIFQIILLKVGILA